MNKYKIISAYFYLYLNFIIFHDLCVYNTKVNYYLKPVEKIVHYNTFRIKCGYLQM